MAAIAAGGVAVLDGCSPSEEDTLTNLVSQGIEDEDIVTLAVAPEQVVEATDFEEVPPDEYLTLQTTHELPLGSLVHQASVSSMLVLLPGGQGESYREIALLNLQSGELNTVVEKPVGTAHGVVIYDARASETALIWVELSLGAFSWQVYVAPLMGAGAGASVGSARLVDEGENSFEPPMLAITAEKAYWTVMPNANGPANLEDSLLRALRLDGLGQGASQEEGGQTGGGTQGDAQGKAQADAQDKAGATAQAAEEKPYTVLASHGRMITNPLITEGVITCVPRVDTGNIYYQLTALNCADDSPRDFTVLPQSLKVSDALYVGGAFSFCIEGNYDYAGGISRFGTYYPLDGATWLHVSRAPVAAPVRLGDCLILKSAINIVGIDLARRKVFVLEAPSGCTEAGEMPAGYGLQDKLITCSLRIDDKTSGAGVLLLRVFG
jgi:hypothetical protein